MDNIKQFINGLQQCPIICCLFHRKHYIRYGANGLIFCKQCKKWRR